MPSFSRNSKSMWMSSFFVDAVTFPVGILLLLLLYWHFAKKIHTNSYFYPPMHRKRHNGSIQTYALFVLQQITLITARLNFSHEFSFRHDLHALGLLQFLSQFGNVFKKSNHWCLFNFYMKRYFLYISLRSNSDGFFNMMQLLLEMTF